jgi:hypothetical protein
MADTSIHQLKITLRHIRPPIWRRFTVPSNVTLAQLHPIIQLVMEWEHFHLYEFRVGDLRFSPPPDWQDMWNEEGEYHPLDLLSEVAPTACSKMRYTYDFGDYWEHDILVEKILPAPEDASSLRCLAGERACPPEDIGGPWRYPFFLEAFWDVNHPEHEEVVSFTNDGFDPEQFDLERVNEQLAILDIESGLLSR